MEKQSVTSRSQITCAASSCASSQSVFQYERLSFPQQWRLGLAPCPHRQLSPSCPPFWTFCSDWSRPQLCASCLGSCYPPLSLPHPSLHLHHQSHLAGDGRIWVSIGLEHKSACENTPCAAYLCRSLGTLARSISLLCPSFRRDSILD